MNESNPSGKDDLEIPKEIMWYQKSRYNIGDSVERMKTKALWTNNSLWIAQSSIKAECEWRQELVSSSKWKIVGLLVWVSLIILQKGTLKFNIVCLWSLLHIGNTTKKKEI